MKKSSPLTFQDLRQIRALGLSKRDVEKQLAVYEKGSAFLKLVRPCLPGDGMISLAPAMREALIARFDTQAGRYKLLKFVPASGAASRMFAAWYSAAAQGSFGSESADAAFYKAFKKMPFATLLLQDPAARSDLKKKNTAGLLDYILSVRGLQYGELPKALIPFHAYPDGEIRTAIEEHLVEAASCVRGRRGKCRLHVTLSPEHIKAVRSRIKAVKTRYEQRYNVQYSIAYSVQAPQTSRLAVDEQNNPFRGADGRLVFRPGGHGALLANLNALSADLIFVKNIDNIVPERLWEKSLPYKKMLGGLAMDIRQTMFTMLRDLETGRMDEAGFNRCTDYCRRVLCRVLPNGFDAFSSARKRKVLFSVLNRPLRVCAMVRNEGEPGGGPFWVEERDGSQTLQIVESAHVNPDDARQQAIWRQAAYFNPVDMVLCIRDLKGKPFDLKKFVDEDAYLISAKTEKGRNLLAQELPGLWNGGMAYWNTVFVEMPVATFNPVKTVDDLLRPQHQSPGQTKRIKA